jgi:dTDP-glucose 4,6-dehydratase
MPLLPEKDLDHIVSHTRGLWEPMRGASVFLTGGTGFVGTWLLAGALRASDEFGLGLAIVVLSRDPGRFVRLAPDIAGHRAVHLLEGDMTGFEPPEGRFPFVIHAATERSFEPDPSRPLGTFDADVAGTRRVLEFARTHGVRRFLFTSSGAVYGTQPPSLTHIPEDYAGAPSTLLPGSAYGQAKRVSEFMCAMYGNTYGFDATIARLFAFVGPLLPLNANFAVGNFIRDVLASGPLRIAGDGTPYRSYLYAADMAIWLWTIVLQGKPAYPYNVGSPRDVTIGELARTVVDVTGGRATIEIAQRPIAGAAPSRYVPSVERAASELRLRDDVSLEEGIMRTFDWHRARDQRISAA